MRRRSRLRTRPVLALLAFGVAGLAPLSAQNSAESGGPEEQPAAEAQPPSEASLFDRTLVADVTTAELAELLDWADTLDLSTRGSRTDVENRILQFYGVSRPPAPAAPAQDDAPEEDTSLARIVRARESEFFEVELVEEDYLRLVGGVVLTMEDGESTHRIEAEELTLNLASDTLAARGNVLYQLSREDGGGESFRGETVLFQIDTWDGVFISGVTERAEDLEQGDVEFSVGGARISRSPNEIIVIDDGSVTSSVAVPPNYRIRAQRIWLLAPGEWGFRRATLYVGRIPAFYLPVFFLPGDRLFFNPAVGTRERSGAFVQTTTYLYGQSEEREPPISIMQLGEAPEDRDREIRGLFLRVPEDPTEPDPEGWSLKVMLDLYSVLGGYTGAEANLPDFGPFDTFAARAGVALSRNVYFENGIYSSFYVDQEGRARTRWNRGYLLGNELPFRYETTFDAGIRGTSWTLDTEFELYSDPEFRRDFADRSEGMDWSFILNSAAVEEESAPSTISSLDWRARGTWRPNVRSLQPWVRSVSVTPILLQLTFRSRATSDLPGPIALPTSDQSPEERFFYPQSAVLPQIGARIDGTLLTLPRQRTVEPERPGSRDRPAEGDRQREDVGGLLPPWEPNEPPPAPAEPAFRLPQRARDATGLVDPREGGFTLGYRVTPSVRYDRFTDDAGWDGAQDVDFDWRYSTLQLRSSGALNSSLTLRDRVAELSNSLDFDLRYQDLDPGSGLDDADRDRLRLEAFRFRRVALSQDTTLTVRPLLRFATLDDSTVAYTLDTELFNRDFEELAGSGAPRYDARFAGWTERDVGSHQTRFSLRWDALGGVQQLEARAELPPRDPAYRGSTTVVTGPLSSTLQGGISEDGDGDWEPDPLVQTHTLSLFDNEVRLNQRIDYDLDRTLLVQSVSSLNAWIATLRLNGRRTGGFRLDPVDGWQDTGAERFRWVSSSLTIDAREEVRFWQRRVDLTLNGRLSLSADLQRFTGSALVLDYGFDLSIYRFLDLEVSARSRNESIYQYVPSLAREAERPPRSLAEDLLDSLRLFDREARERSFFKIDSLDVTAIHDLEDWELRFTYRGRPELDTTGAVSVFQWQSEFSVLVRWRSISELRRNLQVSEGTVEFLQ